MKVNDLLATKGRDVATVGGETMIVDAIDAMSKRHIGALVILDGDTVTGIFSERDLVRGLAENGHECLNSPVSTMMTRKVLTCSGDDTIQYLMELMTENRFRHLPVIEDGKLAGIVSIGDVVKERLREAVSEAEAMRDYITMS